MNRIQQTTNELKKLSAELAEQNYRTPLVVFLIHLQAALTRRGMGFLLHELDPHNFGIPDGTDEDIAALASAFAPLVIEQWNQFSDGFGVKLAATALRGLHLRIR